MYWPALWYCASIPMLDPMCRHICTALMTRILDLDRQRRRLEASIYCGEHHPALLRCEILHP